MSGEIIETRSVTKTFPSGVKTVLVHYLKDTVFDEHSDIRSHDGAYLDNSIYIHLKKNETPDSMESLQTLAHELGPIDAAENSHSAQTDGAVLASIQTALSDAGIENLIPDQWLPSAAFEYLPTLAEIANGPTNRSSILSRHSTYNLAGQSA